MKGEVVVTFDGPLADVRMSFNLPGVVAMMRTENIGYFNGYAETYDAGVRGGPTGSLEVKEDEDNIHSRMWIESQNPARIVVRWRGALGNFEGQVAHADGPVVSPYGPGDWVDEWYYIYPDGRHVRRARIWTHHALASAPFGFERTPPDYIHEFEEIGLAGADGGVPGFDPERDLDVDALTPVKMDGSHATVSYRPYPVPYGAEEEVIYTAFRRVRRRQHVRRQHGLRTSAVRHWGRPRCPDLSLLA